MRHTPAARLAALVVAAALTLPVAACSSNDTPHAAAETTAGPAPTVHAGKTLRSLGRVELDTVAGRLPRAQRRKVLEDVSSAVDGWLTRAYVRGPWPRNDFHDAFWSFTPGAQPRSVADRRLLSNLGAGYRAVTPIRRSIAVDVVAAGRHPVGATARVRLIFRTAPQRSQVVRGRVVLTPTRRGWKIFAYDVSRGQA